MKHDHGPCCLYSMPLLACLTLLPAAGVALPNISVNDVSVTEGSSASALFTVSIDTNPASGQDLRVRVATQNGTAIAGQDYSARSTTLTFRRNRGLSQTFSVPISNDAAAESTETFRVILSNPVNGVIVDSEGIGRIVDNDTPPNRSPICTIDSPAAAVTIRTGTSVTYSSTVTDPDGDPVTINWSFSGGAPATSSIQDPGAVTYGIAGTYTATLSATDNRGAACAPQSRAITVTDPPNVSINSTSQNSSEPIASVVSTPSSLANTSYSLFAINDLGMHCADLDARVVNILPPYQVLLAQLVQKGTRPVLNPAGITLSYSAVSNPLDPILTRASIFNGVKADGTTYKSNFADIIPAGAYDPFYPGGVTRLSQWPTPVTADRGLPVPNSEKLYIGDDGLVRSGDEVLEANQHTMPGISNPYLANSPQPVLERYFSKPVFVDFPFGYVASNLNLYEAAGIPVAPFDDLGRENPYPMIRVAANTGNTLLTTVDTVLPVSGETSCSNCHALATDVPGVRSSRPTDALTHAGLPVATRVDDPDPSMPQRVSAEYASDINILRLHDLRHGPRYVDTSNNSAACDIAANGGNGTPTCLTNRALVQGVTIVCQTCHYTPALDLAQVGPQSGAPGTAANGRNQLAHQSNSRVMHSHHGRFTDLFPTMPAPIQDPVTGAITNQAERQTALENSCYQCHPGKDTKCLRGAMFNGGVLCSDCHGSMAQVGDDFTRNVSPSNPGAFMLGSDFYTNPATPRVPWANEPGCGSCHTGDANGSLATAANVIVNSIDSFGNKDGIRLRQAYRIGDPKATPILPANKRFAEPVVEAAFNGFLNPGAGNPKLYRMSTGHGGVMCEACHGPTHAEWPVANPNANDNIAANQLQGHSGTISECSTCHTTSGLSGTTQAGPHGMHLVNDSRWVSGHESAAKAQNRLAGGGSCGACHGSNHLGTVLSKVPVTRSFTVEGRTRTVLAGKPVACNLCHDLDDSFEN